MTDIFKLPFLNETWINKNGTPVNQLFEFLNQIANNNVKINEGTFNFARYSNLAGVQSVIINPEDGDTVMFANQGLGTYNENAAEWRLSADDTTAVT
ncbi:MAG: hypothetical protein V3V84_07630 [Candidatus Bathyarchaeia archaeon]